jgi:hypothetical protein
LWYKVLRWVPGITGRQKNGEKADWGKENGPQAREDASGARRFQIENFLTLSFSMWQVRRRLGRRIPEDYAASADGIVSG